MDSESIINIETLDVFDNATGEYKGAIVIEYYQNKKKLIAHGKELAELIPEHDIPIKEDEK